MKISIKTKNGGVMKALMGALMAIPALGVFLVFGLWTSLLLLTVYGLYLAFSASIVLGIITFIVEPSPLIFGLVMFFFHKNLAQMLLDFLTK